VNRFVLLFFVVGAAGLCGGPLRAQDAGPSPESFRLHEQAPEYVTKSWTVEDGLPLNVVWSLEQTQDGTLWAGTLDGLAHFDGHSFTTVTVADTDGLAGNRVVGLHEDASGTLWVGTDTGVSTYREGTFRRVDSISRHIEHFSEAPDGTVWMGGRAGLYRWTEAEGIVSIRLPEPLRGRQVKVASGAADSVWVASEATLRLYADGSFRKPERLTGQIENQITSLAASSDRRLITTDSVLVVSSGERVETYVHDGGSVETVRVAPSGEVWMTTLERGLVRLSEGTVQRVRTEGALGDRLRGLVRDDHGQWWIGDHNRGLIRLRPRLFRAVDGGLSGKSGARAVHADDNGVVWAGMGQNGLFQFADSTRRRWTSIQGLPDGSVRTIAEDASGVLWVGTRRGLARLRGRRFTTVKTPEGNDFTRMSALQRDSTGTLLIAAEGQGLHQYRSGTLERVLPADSLHSSRIMGLLRAQDGALWIGTREHGVARLEEGTSLTWYGTDEGVPYRSVRDIYQTRDGTIWISTSGGGIARFEGDHFTPVTPEEGLPHRSIHLIREAPKGVFWMTSNGGVFRVSRAQVEAVADGRLDRLYAQTFGRADGMPARECNGPIHPAFSEDGRGHLWIPTVAGFAVADPHSPQLTLPDSMPVRITAARADGQARPLDSLRFDPSTYRLSIDFTGVSLRHADDLSFRYRLDGEAWTPARGRRTAEFTSLEAGPHRFEVQATIDGGTWYRLDQPLQFVVTPHFYETGWFRLLVLLGLLGLGVGIYRWRTYRLRKRQEELETAVDERTQELAEEKRKTEEQAAKLAELDEAKNRFFAHVSHEFRTPLSLILSPLRDTLQRAAGGAATLSENQLRRMLSSAERLQRLIDQLLELATLEAGQMTLDLQPGDVAAVTTRVAEAFHSKAQEKGLDLRVTGPEDRIQAHFDPEKVETIVSNLVGNAVKFTPDGGRVTVLVERVEATAGVEPPGEAEAAEGTVRIEVADTGPGIDPDAQAQIFDRFEQVDNSATREHEGTGLGLALTGELVELHGGTIEVESTPGEGTVFTAYLPLLPVARPKQKPGDGQPPARGEPVGGAAERREAQVDGKEIAGDGGPVENAGEGREVTGGEEEPSTILVVEDNAEMRAYLREALSRQWRMLEAADGEAGWTKVQEDAPDLVLSDVMMPNVGGFELCERIKSDPDLRTVPVVLLTARTRDEDTLEGLECGADDYVAKPFDPAELRRRIENHLAAREHLRERHRTEVRMAPVDTVVEEEDVPFVEEVIEAVETRLSDPGLTVSQIADAVALSRRQLTRRLKDAVGQAPAAFVRTRRIERAKELLEEAPETIAEVAYAVGFRSPSSFTKTFREETGHTPTEYVDEHDA
jgi:signal transduction histidine kinase/ligand-binding sensor domain-containing protein/DNA-binding response OmpR family regulator